MISHFYNFIVACPGIKRIIVDADTFFRLWHEGYFMNAFSNEGPERPPEQDDMLKIGNVEIEWQRDI